MQAGAFLFAALSVTGRLRTLRQLPHGGSQVTIVNSGKGGGKANFSLCFASPPSVPGLTHVCLPPPAGEVARPQAVTERGEECINIHKMTHKNEKYTLAPSARDKEKKAKTKKE